MKDCSDQFIVEDDDSVRADVQVTVKCHSKAAQTPLHTPAAGDGADVDPHKLAQRQKQVDFGKNTLGYQRYLELVPRKRRGKRDPQTPDIAQRVSKRAFDGQIKAWRRMLHMYDEGDQPDPSVPRSGRLSGGPASNGRPTEDGGDAGLSAPASPTTSLGTLDGYLPPVSRPAPMVDDLAASKKRTYCSTRDAQAGTSKLAPGITLLGQGASAGDRLGPGMEGEAGEGVRSAADPCTPLEPEPKRSTSSRCREPSAGPSMSVSWGGIFKPSSCQAAASNIASTCSQPGAQDLASADVSTAGVANSRAVPPLDPAPTACATPPLPQQPAAGLVLTAATNFQGLGARLGVAAAGVTGVRTASGSLVSPASGYEPVGQQPCSKAANETKAEEDDVVAMILNGGANSMSCMSWQPGPEDELDDVGL